jgi:type VI secretion system protein ImpB
VSPLRKLLELRNSLANLRSSLIGNEKLDSLLQEIIQDQELLRQAGAEAGLMPAGDKED